MYTKIEHGPGIQECILGRLIKETRSSASTGAVEICKSLGLSEEHFSPVVYGMIYNLCLKGEILTAEALHSSLTLEEGHKTGLSKYLAKFLNQDLGEIGETVHALTGKGLLLEFILKTGEDQIKDIDDSQLDKYFFASCKKVIWEEVKNNKQIGQLRVFFQDKNLSEAEQQFLSIRECITYLGPNILVTAKGELVKLDSKRALEECLQEGQSHKISTSFKALDKVLNGGFTLGSFIVVGGRTSMGKTTFLINMASEIAKEYPCLVLSLENSYRSIRNIFLARTHKLRLSDFEKNDSVVINEVLMRDGVQSKLNFHLLAKKGLIVDNIRQVIMKSIIEDKIKVVMIDSAQQVRARDKESRRDIMVTLTQELDFLAKSKEIIIILTSQLSRGLTEELPALHHLKESASLEYDPDLILLLDTPQQRLQIKKEHVEFESEDIDQNIKDAWGKLVINIVKNRAGPSSKVDLKFDLERGLIENF